MDRNDIWAEWREAVRDIAEAAGLGRRWLSSLAIFKYADGVVVMQPQDFDFGKGDGGKRAITEALAAKLEALIDQARKLYPDQSARRPMAAFYSLRSKPSDKRWADFKNRPFKF